MNASRIIRFAGVSLAGLCLDYVVYAALYAAGLAAGYANLVSAATGVTFVYLLSGRHIFRASGKDLHRLFWAYALFQAVAVPLASVAVEAATVALDQRYLLGKTVVLPFTFAANYLFTSWLLSERGQGAASPS